MSWWTSVGMSAGMVMGVLIVPAAGAQDDSAVAAVERTTGWFNTTELSLVATRGNSDTTTFGFKDLLRRIYDRSRFQLRLEGVQAQTADSAYAIVDVDSLIPGVPIEDQSPSYEVVRPPGTPDVEKYLVEAKYDRNIQEKLLWNSGVGWDRNLDAGIENRYQVFAGLSRLWWTGDDLAFRTDLGLSYTDRQETNPDPSRDADFPGLRFEWDYGNLWTKTTRFTNRWTINSNLTELSDYRFDMISAVSVSMTEKIALQISLQWLYENQPALESIDLVLLTDGGVPIGTCPASCSETVVGSVDIFKKKLDTVFNTSLVVRF